MKELTSVGSVFTEVFKVKNVETKKTNGFATISQKNELVLLKVLSKTNDNPWLNAGDYILVKSSDYIQPWARDERVFENTTFISVPLTAVLGFKRESDTSVRPLPATLPNPSNGVLVE